MQPYEITLAIKLRAENADAALEKGRQLAKAIGSKTGYAECQCVQKIREDEMPKGKK